MPQSKSNKKKNKNLTSSLMSLEQIPIKQDELIKSLPALPLPVNKDVNIDAYVDVNQLKSAIAIQFRGELLKASSTILSCLVCENINNAGICKVCFRSNDKPLPAYTSTYGDNMKKRINAKGPKTATTTTQDISKSSTRPLLSTVDQFNKTKRKIPSWYNLPYNQTILKQKQSSNHKNSELDEFLQSSFRDKFTQLQLNNKQ